MKKKLFVLVVGGLMVVLLGALTAETVDRLYIEPRTVSSWGELVDCYLAARTSLPPLPSPVPYEEVFQKMSAADWSFLAGYWQYKQTDGTYYVAKDSRLRQSSGGAGRLEKLKLPLYIRVYEDLQRGEIVVLSSVDGEKYQGEALFQAPEFMPYEKDFPLDRYLSDELSPRRIVWEIILKSEADAWMDIVLQRDEAAASQRLEEGGMMAMMSVPAEHTGDLWLGLEPQSGSMNLNVFAPEGFTNRVEIYSSTDLISNTWNIAAQGLLPSGTNPAVWNTGSVPVHFYNAGNMDIDSDGDGVPDAREQYVHKTSSDRWDSDADWMPDGWEMTNSLNALTSDGGADADGDGLSNRDEYQRGTDPHNSDTDGDGLSDGAEVLAGTDPFQADSDGDGLPDAWEVRFGYDPLNKPGALSGADQVGQFDTSGSALAVEIHSDVAYVADGTNGLVILDVRHPGGRKLSSLPLEGVANDLLLTNNTLWMALGSNGVAAVDVSDPFRPRKQGAYYTDGWTDGLAFQSNLLYIANTARDFLILNVQDPDDMVQVGLYNYYFSSGGYGVCVKGTNAWFTVKDRIYQLNVSVPSVPEYIRNNGLPSNNPHDMQMTSNRLYVTTDSHLSIWDQRLNQMGKIITAGIAYGFGMESNRVLVAEGVNSAELIDISNEAAPAVITNVVVSGFVNDAALRWERGYLAAGEGGLIVIRFATDADGDDMDDNWEIRYFGSTGASATNDFDGDGILNREEFTIGTNPVSTDSDADGLSDHNEVWVYGSDPVRADGDLDGLSDYAEVNTHHTHPAEADTDGDGMPDGWEILNGFNPLMDDGADDADSDGLSNAGEYLTHTDPHNADSDGDTLSDRWEALHGTSNQHTNYPLRASFEQIALRDTPGEARSVFVKDGWLYAADGTNGLVIFDLSIPAAPVLTATLDTAGFAYDVAVSNQYAYVADGVNGLVIVAVSNPASPIIAGYTNTAGTAEGVAVQSNYVYLADGTNSLMTFDVSNKVSPKVTSDYPPTTPMSDVFVQGASVYASLSGRVWRFSLVNPAVPVWAAGAGFVNRNMLGIHGNGSVIVAVAGTNGAWFMSSNLDVFLGSYDTGGTASGVFVSSNYAYIADGPGGLTVLDISTPSAPVMKYQQDTAGFACGVFPNGEYVYVADGTNGVVVFRLVEDSDGDGMSDYWERAYFENLSQTATGDFDGDGINNGAEYRIAGNPCTNDADGDLLSDYAEIWTYHTQPLSRDTDFDGRDDRAEVLGLGGAAATDPLNPDCDHDGLLDGAEIAAGSNPHLADTDEDGIPDGWEVANGLSPTVANASSDFDGDGLSNLAEYQRGSKANVPDTDNDGLNDGAEVTAGTGLLSADSDGDGLNDGAEVAAGANPLNPDSDGDGMPDGWEVTNGLSPTTANASADLDNDGLNNLAEYQHGAKANAADSDSDGLSDYYEITHGLNPASSDSDGDGLSDQNDKQPGSFEAMIPDTVITERYFSSGFTYNSQTPLYIGTHHFVPTNLPPTNVTFTITNVVMQGFVWDAFKINGIPYAWGMDPKNYTNNITANVAATLGGTNVSGFFVDLYKWNSGTTYSADVLYAKVIMQLEKAVPLDLVPDYDRNGIIDTNDLSRLRTGEPFRFWVNDDDDSGYDGGQDIPGIGKLNYNDGLVNGVRDLIDFFPVYLSLSNLVAELPPVAPAGEPHYTYYLRHADNDVLQGVITDLTPDHTGNYLRDLSTADSLASAGIHYIGTGGWELPAAFVDSIRTGNKGILLIEAAKPTTAPLRLTVYDTNSQIIAERELPLSITSVTNMFRHKNLRPSPTVTDRASAPNELPSNGKNFVFVHGYNVDERAARGWHAEMFKRLYWSGSNARFYGITWYGNQSQFPLVAITPNYQINIPNAWVAASNLNTWLGSIPGEKIIAAHSLGNMLVSAAIQDYSAPVSKFFMIDAAVAMEAYDNTSSDIAAMRHPYWTGYSNRLWATEWHQLFDPGDGRRELTWRNRFSSVVPKAYNFYSSGEEVLERHTGVPYKLTVAWNVGQYSWCVQEKLKGRLEFFPWGGSTYGGWGINMRDYGWNPDQYLHEGHAMLSDEALKTKPFFEPGGFGASALYYNSGSSYAFANQSKFLAQMIPALSLPVGANLASRFNDFGTRNFNMDTGGDDGFKNGWGRNHSEYGQRWLHSDIRDMSYLYVYKVFDKFTGEGVLK